MYKIDLLEDVESLLYYANNEREFGVYKNLNDNYPKYVITTDTMDFSQDGIIHKNIIDWLLDK